jgi:Ser/Thr protein kinase RdoA (MazF antagonist)
MQECKAAIQILQAAYPLVTKFESYTQHADVKRRVTHHDTKISNVLFNEQEQGICVIDLDTVMPGYFISDTGDMFRTYVCAVTEEEQQLDLITVRKEYTAAIVAGYLSEMGRELSNYEQDHIYFGGEVLMYMQALRFLADYLQMDKYYGSRYPTQNKVRAENQIRLLTLFQESLR